MRVLLIEDDSATAQSIELMLKSEGFNVYTTDLGEEGVDLGKIYDYDLILLDLNLPDIAELWRRGSVVSSWLLDLTATALLEDPALGKFAGRVSDSGEGRWTIKAAIDEAVPAPVLTTALYERFSSRREADFQNKLLSAMRFQFGGHHEKPAGT